MFGEPGTAPRISCSLLKTAYSSHVKRLSCFSNKNLINANSGPSISVCAKQNMECFRHTFAAGTEVGVVAATVVVAAKVVVATVAATVVAPLGDSPWLDCNLASLLEVEMVVDFSTNDDSHVVANGVGTVVGTGVGTSVVTGGVVGVAPTSICQCKFVVAWLHFASPTEEPVGDKQVPIIPLTSASLTS